MSKRIKHHNGVECIHGHFLHEYCNECRIAELEGMFNISREGHLAANKKVAELEAHIRSDMCDPEHECLHCKKSRALLEKGHE